MVHKPTHESGSLLDHIYINDGLDQTGFSTQVDACYYSDHDIVSLYVSKQNKHQKPKEYCYVFVNLVQNFSLEFDKLTFESVLSYKSA